MRPIQVILVLCVATACGSNGDSSRTVNRDTLTQRQKDSLIAHSTLPGAAGVRGAMSAADAANARTARADSLARDTAPE